ncbi:hypothetical protein GCM10010260_71780 [Streptomyces filipinensis]|uniref:Uncharacterized protein n=1 Tax=Streptomyces filipinensis TaxID=66887 RepID=A0A918MEI1_9ACTN|nr:hypothetical protein GCM10010260_71780 [Streptomyces filipinensis]
MYAPNRSSSGTAYANPYSWVTVGVRAAGALAVVIGGLTAVEYATGAALGIDELLFKDAARTASEVPGRMAPNAAAALLAGGVAALCASASRLPAWTSQVPAWQSSPWECCEHRRGSAGNRCLPVSGGSPPCHPAFMAASPPGTRPRTSMPKIQPARPDAPSTAASRAAP